GQQRPAHDGRQVGEGVDGGGGQRRAGPVVDEDGQRDLGELVAEQGQALRVPEGPELLDGDDLAIGGLTLGGSPVPPRQPSRPHGPHWTPLCLTHSVEYVT